MAYAKMNIKDLTKKMSSSNNVIDNWDVLCSCDLQSLNKVLLEEYKKHSVNSKLKFTTTKIITGFRYEVYCDIKLGNPIMHFSAVESGIYDLQIPMETGSYCNQTFQGDITKTIIPSGYKILTSGPIKSVKGNERNKTVYSANEVIEFGKELEATIVLRFGKDLRNVSIFPENIHEDFQSIFDDITSNFVNNIKEVNYKIIQVRKETLKKGLILTPKSFIFTTMADDRNRENGALNIWIQTNESGRPRGNPQPSFYPNSTVLPVPMGYSTSLIFSYQLVYHNYLKPALMKFYEVTLTDFATNNGIRVDAISLVPKNRSSQVFFKSFPGLDLFTYEFNVDFNTSPLQIYAHDDNLRLVWIHETVLEYQETKVVESMAVGITAGTGIGAAIGAIFGGPIGALLGVAFGAAGGSIGGAITSAVDQIKQQFTVTLSIDKPIPFVSTDNTKFSSKIKLLPQDLHVNAKLKSKSGFRLFKLTNVGLSSKDIQSDIIPELQRIITMPDIDFGTLDYFAEANILFNEGRFKISANKAVHFPYDALIIGDVDIPHGSKYRHKREQNYLFDYTEKITSSATTLTSPINCIVNWITGSFTQFQFVNHFHGIYKILALPQTTNNSHSSEALYGINNSLLLGDLVIRSFTKKKLYYTTEKPINYTHIKANTLNILAEYENLLEKYGLISAFPEFDPLLLMSALEKEIINRNLNRVLDILYKPTFDSVLAEKINIKNEIRRIIIKEELLLKH